MSDQEQYQFTAKPKVIQGNQTKFRDPASLPTNIMWDKRVVRGNTYSSIVTQKGNENQVSARPVRRRPKAADLQEVQEEENDLQTRFKRKENQEVQTDENVEELTDKPPNYQKETQTDFIIEKEVLRLYMRPKTGIDKETQVWDDGELFNFDYEVEPILQALVGKTLEISRMEVLEEEELREMREQQRYYTQLQQAELAEQQRLEEAEIKRNEENLKTKQIQTAKKNLQIKAHEKMVSRVLAKQFLKKVEGNSLRLLNNQGFFRPEIEVDLQSLYLPWLYTEVQLELKTEVSAEVDYQNLLQVIESRLTITHEQVYQQEMKHRSEIMEERERQRLEYEDRQAKRREARRIRLENERRQKIKDAIVEKMVSKGDLKTNLLNLVFSDIDCFQQNQPFAGLFGGFIGELIIFLSALQELANEGSQAQFKGFFQSMDSIDELISALLTSLIANPDIIIEVGISSAADQLLEAIDPALNIQALNGALTTSAQIQTILQENLHSIILFCLKENYLTFGLNKDIIDSVCSYFIKTALNVETIRPKIRFIKVNKEIVKFDQISLAKVRPILDELPFNAKSGKQKQDPEDQEATPIAASNIAEMDVELKQTLFPFQVEDLKVLALHSVIEFHLRQIVLDTINEIQPLEPNSEFHILVEATEKCEALQNAILDIIAPELPVLELGVY